MTRLQDTWNPSGKIKKRMAELSWKERSERHKAIQAASNVVDLIGWSIRKSDIDADLYRRGYLRDKYSCHRDILVRYLGLRSSEAPFETEIIAMPKRKVG